MAAGDAPPGQGTEAEAAVTLHCIVCQKPLENIMGDRGVQPNDGLAFHTAGHYGSTVYDDLGDITRPNYIHVCVCDNCVQQAIEKGMVYMVHVEPVPPPPTRLVRWNPEDEGPWILEDGEIHPVR